jgi:HEPN domain-containing protein
MQEPKGEAARWLTQAEYDLRAAQTNADSELYAYACFIAQQAAEKALKAILYAYGARQVLGHSVADLSRQAAKKDKSLEPLTAQAAKLDRFYIPTRYPNGLPGGIPAEVYDRADGDEAIQLARQVVDTVKKSFAAQAKRERRNKEKSDEKKKE